MTPATRLETHIFLLNPHDAHNIIMIHGARLGVEIGTEFSISDEFDPKISDFENTFSISNFEFPISDFFDFFFG